MSFGRLGSMGRGFGSLGGKRGGAGPAIVENQSLAIGSDTLSGAGGIRPVFSGGTPTLWAISGGQSANYAINSSTGYITPATDGSAVDGDTFTLTVDGADTATITISAAANTYHVSSRTELLAIKALTAATYTGKTIILRDGGSYIGDGTIINWTSQTPAAEVTITSETNRGALTPGFDIGSSSNIRLEALRCNREWTTGTTVCVIRTNGSTDCTAHDCEIWSNVLSTVTMESDPEVLSGVGVDSTTAATGFTCTENYIHDVRRAIRHYGTGLTYSNNTLEDCTENFGIFIGDISGMVAKGNRGVGVWANGSDPGNPHSSLFSFQAGAANSTSVLVEGNIFLVGTARFEHDGVYGFATGLKLNVTGVGVYDGFDILNNVLGPNGNIAIEFAQATNSRVEWNTLVCPDDTYFGSQGVPGISYYDLGVNCSIQNNIVGGFDDDGGHAETPTVDNNETILRANYSTKFDGATFSGVTPTTALVKFNPLAGSTMLTADPKIGAIGTGYYDFNTDTGSWPSGAATSVAAQFLMMEAA